MTDYKIARLCDFLSKIPLVDVIPGHGHISAWIWRLLVTVIWTQWEKRISLDRNPD